MQLIDGHRMAVIRDKIIDTISNSVTIGYEIEMNCTTRMRD